MRQRLTFQEVSVAVVTSGEECFVRLLDAKSGAPLRETILCDGGGWESILDAGLMQRAGLINLWSCRRSICRVSNTYLSTPNHSEHLLLLLRSMLLSRIQNIPTLVSRSDCRNSLNEHSG